MESFHSFLIATLLLLLRSSATADDAGYYVITAANQARPGTPFLVCVTYFSSQSNSNSSLHIKATLVGTPFPVGSGGPKVAKNSFKAGSSGTVCSGSTQCIPIKVGNNWQQANYILQVDGSRGSLQFQRSISVGFNDKKSSLFIQTDKGIYQGGQKVQLRVVSVNSELLPFTNKSLSVYINDASGNRIQQWDTVVPKSGIFEAQLQLSSQPILGSWSVQASSQQMQASVAFDVQQYVLPRFEVNLKVPQFITTKTESFPVSITAKYTNGQPLIGSYLLNVSQTYCYNCKSTPVVIKGDISGTATAEIKTGDLNLGKDFQYGTNLNISVDVSERYTSIVRSTWQQLQTYAQDKQILVSVPSNYKPLTKLLIKISLTDPVGNPIPNPSGEGKVTYQYSNSAKTITKLFAFNEFGYDWTSITPPLDAQSITITVDYDGLTGYGYSSPVNSLSDKYMTINSDSKKPKVGKQLTINVATTFQMQGFINYQVVGRGKILIGKTLDLEGRVKTANFSFELTQDMAPNAAIVVYYVTGCGEIVGDVLSINVAGLMRTQLKLQLSTDKAEPADNVTLKITTGPRTHVALSAVDKSVFLLRNGNEITESQVVNDIMQYGVGQTVSPYYVVGEIFRPFPTGSLDSIFNYAGLVMVTNGLYYKEQRCRFFYDKVVSLHGEALPAAGGGSNGLVQPTHVRQYFPETWFFEIVKSNSKGKTTLQLKVPDTITTWVIGGFAINSNTGLGLLGQHQNLTVSRGFFLVVNLPYSVIRGETIAVQVLVFNNFAQDLPTVVVTMQQDSDSPAQFSFVDSNDQSQSRTQNISVKANDVAQVTFVIKPTEVANIPLSIKAASNLAGDAIIANLKVKPEGVALYFSKATLCDLRNAPSSQDTIQIEVSPEAVPGSLYTEFNGQGNVMASVLSNTQNLIQLPTGCGEQNMINFVPDVVVMKFLTLVNRLSEDDKNKLLNYLLTGYQQELKYQRFDGSFSAFGNVDNYGSTWLTAFVVKSFMLAKPYIFIDDNVITRAKTYLVQNQAEDGSFTEVGKVLDQIQGGSAITPVTLTAFVLIAFLETPSSDSATYETNVNRAVQYIEQNYEQDVNAYTITIVTYVLYLAKSSKADAAYEKMSTLAKTEGNFLYWHYDVPKPVEESKYWSPPAPSYDVEATSYALLVYQVKGASPAEQLPIVRWLITKKNNFGGYSSTQDTVIAIQALGTVGPSFVGPEDSTVSMEIAYGDKKQAFTFNHDNQLVIQQQELTPNTIQSVDVSCSGNGVAIAQIYWTYNMPTGQTGNDIFILTSSAAAGDGTAVYSLNVCASYSKNETTGMVIMQVNTLSGYVWTNWPAVGSMKELSSVENLNSDAMLVLYFSNVPTSPEGVCVTLTATQTNVVSDLKDAVIDVYRYYQTGDRTVKFYNLGEPTNSNSQPDSTTAEE